MTPSEIIHIVALRQFFRTRSSNKALKNQFKDLPPAPLTKWMIDEHRYCAIINSMNCDWKIFPGLLRKGWCEAVNPGDKITVDETLFSFFSQADKTSPPKSTYQENLIQMDYCPILQVSIWIAEFPMSLISSPRSEEATSATQEMP